MFDSLMSFVGVLFVVGLVAYVGWPAITALRQQRWILAAQILTVNVVVWGLAFYINSGAEPGTFRRSAAILMAIGVYKLSNLMLKEGAPPNAVQKPA
jgi:hypothetical protein